MIECGNAEMRDRLADLTSDAMSDEDRTLVLAHVTTCAECAAELELLRSMRSMMVAATPRVNVDGIVAALPVPGVVPISAARSARRRSWGSFQVAAAATVLAAFLGGYSVIKQHPAAVLDTMPVTTQVADTSAGLSMTGALADLSDDQLAALVKDIDKIEALPSAEVEHLTTVPPTVLPDSVFLDMEGT